MQYDDVDNPEHYDLEGMQVIEVIRSALTPEEFAGYCRGNQLKYLLRLHKKDTPQKNAGKSNWYGERLLRALKEQYD